ncbi:sensor histidine kinase [Pararhizobium gei]|uniref:sensor histidine kinase n=1 Tax=Pararhizobium gei TaxID=1395951 RepID=UPI0023DC840C|nr:sensor histidine kinase [Rhizobium gei]
MDEIADSRNAWRASWTTRLRSRLRRPLAVYLTILLLVAIVPSFMFSMIIVKRSTDEQERVVTALLKASTGSVTRIVEREVDSMISTLKVFAGASTIKASTLENLYKNAVTSLSGTDSYLLLIDRAHNQLLNTRVPFGTKLPKASDPSSVDEAFKGSGPLVSHVFFGRTAKKWVFNVYLPSEDGAYLLTLTQNAENMQKAVNQDMLSPGWNAALLDSAGKVVVSSDASVEVGQPFFMDIVPALRVGVGEATRHGVSYRTVTEFSVLTGWKIVAWAKKSAVDAPALWSYLWLSLGGILFAGIAVAGSVAIAGLLAQGVTIIARDARLLGAGQPIEPRRHMISEIETVSLALSEAAQARREAENEIRFLAREVAHRSKNQLTVIQSMLNQSLNAAESRVDFADSFRKRIAGLARSTDLMIANAALGVDFRELAQNQLQPFIPDDPQRVILCGPTVRLDTQVSQMLGMALHELATNATKYGALADSRGVVALTWTLSETEFQLVWRETGVDIKSDASAEPRKGFGTIVLERMLGMSLDARLERIMHGDGIEWRVLIAQHRLNANLPKDLGADPLSLKG